MEVVKRIFERTSRKTANYLSNKEYSRSYVNDIVLVYNDRTPKSQWKIGNILKLIRSNDERIRGAIVQTKTNGNGHLIKRPISRLYPLKCDKKDKDVKIRIVDDTKIRMMQKSDT